MEKSLKITCVGIFITVVSACFFSCFEKNNNQQQTGGSSYPDSISIHGEKDTINAKANDTTSNFPATAFTHTNKKSHESYITGVVKNAAGNHLADVTITSGNTNIKTGENGFFLIEKAQLVNGRFVLHFHKKGYFSLVRSFEKRANRVIEVVLQPAVNSEYSLHSFFEASEGVVLKVGKMEIDIPANSMKDVSGNAYNGKVYTDVFYLDPNHKDFSSMMPGGDLAAVRTNGEEVILYSYGMVKVDLKDESGNKLQLKENSTLTYPIPAGMEKHTPASIPLWHFNETTGLWEEQGLAYRKGNIYTGEVSHFSWYNLDIPATRATVQGRVTDCKGEPIGGVKVTVGQTYTHTAQNGQYAVYIPAGVPVDITVSSKEYFNYADTLTYAIKGQAGEAVVTQDIILPCIPEIKGVINNTCGNDTWSIVYCEYKLKKNRQKYFTNSVSLFSGEEFKIKLPPKVEKAILHVQLSNGKKLQQKINYNGKDVMMENINTCVKEEEGIISNIQIIYPNKIRIFPFHDKNSKLEFAGNQMLIQNNEIPYANLSFTFDKTMPSDDPLNLAPESKDILMVNSEKYIVKTHIISKKDNRIKIRVNGSFIDYIDTIKITGIINLSTKDILIKEEWREMCLPEEIPQLFASRNAYYNSQKNDTAQIIYLSQSPIYDIKYLDTHLSAVNNKNDKAGETHLIRKILLKHGFSKPSASSFLEITEPSYNMGKGRKFLRVCDYYYKNDKHDIEMIVGEHSYFDTDGFGFPRKISYYDPIVKIIIRPKKENS